MSSACLICHRPWAEMTEWPDWVTAAATLFESLPRCGPRCLGHHSLAWRDPRGRWHVWQHDDPPNDPPAHNGVVPNIERRMHKTPIERNRNGHD